MIQRWLQKWRERHDGTLKGPSLSTDSAVIGDANVRTLDGKVENPSTPLTYNLNDTYDIVWIEYEQTTTGGNNEQFRLFFNGDNAAEYNYRTGSGSKTTGANTVPIFATNQDHSFGAFRVTGRWENTLVFTNQTYDQFGSNAVSGNHPFIGSGELSSFTITTDSSGNTGDDSNQAMPSLYIYGRGLE